MEKQNSEKLFWQFDVEYSFGKLNSLIAGPSQSAADQLRCVQGRRGDIKSDPTRLTTMIPLADDDTLHSAS